MAVYTIRVKGHIGAEWSEWLDGFQMSRETNGETVLSGVVSDQAALFGLLTKVRDLGLPLLSITDGPPDAEAEAAHGSTGSGTVERR